VNWADFFVLYYNWKSAFWDKLSPKEEQNLLEYPAVDGSASLVLLSGLLSHVILCDNGTVCDDIKREQKIDLFYVLLV